MTGRFPVWYPTLTWQNVIEQSEVINAALINYSLKKKKKILLWCYWARQVTPTIVTLCQLESMLPGCSSPWQHTPSSYPAELASQSAEKKRDRFNVGTTSSPGMMLSPSGLECINTTYSLLGVEIANISTLWINEYMSPPHLFLIGCTPWQKKKKKKKKTLSLLPVCWNQHVDSALMTASCCNYGNNQKNDTIYIIQAHFSAEKWKCSMTELQKWHTVQRCAVLFNPSK